MTRRVTNVAASVSARLLAVARAQNEDFQLILLRYANERLLYRLSVSSHVSSFVLKGAALFTLWTGRAHRATKDIDLLGFGDPTEARIRLVFQELLSLEQDDGVVFDVRALEVGPIRAGEEYVGARVRVSARIGPAQLRLQIDIGFGDAITPPPVTIEYPVLLASSPSPKLRAYPRETAIAEKLHAMVEHGMANSRMKDFYDIALLARLFDFEGDTLTEAIRATFARRDTDPPSVPVAFTNEFFDDDDKRRQWTAFVRKAHVRDASDLPGTVRQVDAFLREPLHFAAGRQPFALRWLAGGPWK